MTVKRLLDSEEPVTDVMARILAQAGITQFVGVSGGHTGRIYSALEKYQNAIRTMLVREESLGSVIAEVYGRLTRRPGVLCGQGPWILGNGLLGTIEAHLSSTPMLLLTDFSDTPNFSLHGAYQTGTGDWGAWDARQAFKGVTKQVFEAATPAEAVHALQLAIKHSMSGQPGPVAVLFHARALSGKVGPDSRLRLYPTSYYMPSAPPPAAPAAVDAVVDLLLKAKKPVLIAGNGVRIGQAYDSLARVAAGFGLPVVTTASGKGVIAETGDFALGVFGTFGTAAANACVAEADVVLVAASKLTAGDTAYENPALLDPERQTFIQIDIEPRNAAWTYPAEHVLIGDISTVLDQIETARAGRKPAVDGKARVAALRAAHGHFDLSKYDSETEVILPQRIISELMRNLPDDAIVCTDAGENRIFSTHYFQVKKAGSFLPSAGAGPMGYGIPAAMGAKLVHPERPAVAVVGDGGFAMTMNGLMTAIEHDIPVIVVVFNNSALGWSMHLRGPFAAEFNDFDHAAIARAMGCVGIRVDDPAQLRPAIKEALASRKPVVIDVVTSLKSTFAEVTSSYAKA